jgi:hypothetical protein
LLSAVNHGHIGSTASGVTSNVWLDRRTRTPGSLDRVRWVDLAGRKCTGFRRASCCVVCSPPVASKNKSVVKRGRRVAFGGHGVRACAPPRFPAEKTRARRGVPRPRTQRDSQPAGDLSPPADNKICGWLNWSPIQGSVRKGGPMNLAV